MNSPMPEVAIPELEEEDYYSVVIFNDDITPFDVVIFAIQKVTGINFYVMTHGEIIILFKKINQTEQEEKLKKNKIIIEKIDNTLPK